MKLNIPTLRIAGALGLAAGLMIGCQDFLGSDKNDADSPPADETGALSLSIRNDSNCLGEWHAILEARGAGHPDSAAEEAFLHACVTEVKPEKGNPKPVIPPPLLPDSGMRCRWIVAQIEGGRDSLTVSYRKYCPDDCRKIEGDSAHHAMLCHEPKPHPDSLPPRPNPIPDTCRLLHEKLEAVAPGQPGRAELEHRFAALCKEPIPHDTLIVPPKPPRDTCPIPPKPPLPGPDADTCKMILEKLAHLAPGTEEYLKWKEIFVARCGGIVPPPPPRDTLPPIHDTVLVPPKPPAHDSICLDLKLRLQASAVGTRDRAELEAALKTMCSTPVVPPPQPLDCDALRLKLSSLDTASADYARLAGTLKEHCAEIR